MSGIRARAGSPAAAALLRLEANTHRINDGCRLWNGAVDAKGYGRTYIAARCQLVHVFAHQLRRGEALPKGSRLRNLCGNRHCLTDSHWEVSSLQEINAQRKGLKRSAIAVARATAGRRKAGKLSMEAARLMRQSPEPLSALAARFGVHKSMVARIKQGTAWKETSPWQS